MTLAPTPTSPSAARIEALDGLRAVAILLVLGFHARLPVLKGGFVGVDLFFVLSGFLITSLIDQEWARTGRLDAVHFLRRRAARILPAVAVLLLGVTAINLALFPEVHPIVAIELALPVASFTANYTKAYLDIPTSLAHTWSLAVEMHFYLLWPYVLPALLARLSRSRCAALIAGLAVADYVWRCLAQGWLGAAHAYYATDTHVSGLLIGAAVAIARPDLPLAWRRVLSVGSVAALATLALSLDFMAPASTWLAPAVDAAAVGLVVGAVDGRLWLTRFLSLWPLVRLGRISYGFYLWHFPILYYLSDWSSPWSQFGWGLVLSTVVASASFHLIEVPWRKRIMQ